MPLLFAVANSPLLIAFTRVETFSRALFVAFRYWRRHDIVLSAPIVFVSREEDQGHNEGKHATLAPFPDALLVVGDVETFCLFCCTQLFCAYPTSYSALQNNTGPAVERTNTQT